MQKAFTSQNWYWGKNMAWHCTVPIQIYMELVLPPTLLRYTWRYTWSDTGKKTWHDIVKRGVLLLTKWSRQGNHARCIVLPKALWHMQAFCRDFSGTENHVLICDRPLYNCSCSCLKVIQQQNASYAIFWSEQHLCWKIIYSPDLLFVSEKDQPNYHHCISIKKSLFHFMCFIQWNMVKGPSESQFI